MHVACANLARTARSVDEKYTGVTTAWTDNARGVHVSGMLSAVGKNITDQRMVSEDGGVIPFLRTDNYDEHLGIVSPDKIVVTSKAETLGDVLERLDDFTAYAGKKVKNVAKVTKVAVRYQNAFVGVRPGEKRNVAPSNFSYQTFSDDDPRNLLLVCTSTGIYVHQDGVGYKNLLANEAEGSTLVNKWFAVEESNVAVGHAVGWRMTRRRVELGLKGSGPRENRMLVVSIPLKQQKQPPSFSSSAPHYRGLCVPPIGRSRAARLSVGDVVDVQECIDTLEVDMDDSEMVVVTQIDYNTVTAEGGVVQVGDDAVQGAIEDMNRQYGMCDVQCKLSQLPEMLHQWKKEEEVAQDV